jgi:hypothetical protein
MEDFPKMTEIPVEGFMWAESMRNTVNGPEKWTTDWLSHKSTYCITYYHEDGVYYVYKEFQRKEDIADDYKFKDLDSAVAFVREHETENL